MTLRNGKLPLFKFHSGNTYEGEWLNDKQHGHGIMTRVPLRQMRNKKVCQVVYYESTKQELQTKPIHECQCDERLKTDMQVDRRETQPRTRRVHEELKASYTSIVRRVYTLTHGRLSFLFDFLFDTVTS
jgi:hypothetical protein